MISSSNPVARSPRTVPRRAANRIAGQRRRRATRRGTARAGCGRRRRPSSGRPRRCRRSRRAPGRWPMRWSTTHADGEQDDEEHERQRQRADQVVLAEAVEPRREVADRAVLDEHPRRAAPADQPGQRDDERRQTEPGDAPAVDQPGDARRRRGRRRWPATNGHVVLVQRGQHAADHAITEATDRSISPAMMTNVIVTTTMTFSMCSWKRLTKLSTLEVAARLREVEDDRRRAGSAPSTSSQV